ncbi:MAG: tRNA (adenosine(37)-N6)-threonylcarbamoyltransferase complex dimerization subunit type 1 TsaB [Lachnospiraceae bacterium]|nr:tRNA (adenosine(37)-N6)-threonylcarbamoyltransferase complex dimerization subunit type 1 TsaB [Lachnospiraceae bacterium]
MRLAAIESSSLVASVALLEDDVLVAEYTTCYQKTHSQTLLPMMEQIFAMTGAEPESLDCIAISSGPGSFTGLRIGSATAKGLGLALDIPLVEVPTLEAMAYQLYGNRDLICPMMDARRGQVYTGVYTFTQDNAFICVKEPMAAAAEEILAFLNARGQRVILLGDGVPVHKELIEKSLTVPFSFAPAFCMRQRAAAVAQLGANYYREGRAIPSDQHAPSYYRISQAERERMEREHGA